MSWKKILLAPSSIQCYQEWLVEEMVQGDSLAYKVWTFGFLTHDWVFSPYYQDQISTFLDFLEANYIGHYTPRGNLIARYSTCSQVVDEYLAWENTHPGQSSFSHIHPYPQSPLLNEAMIFPADSTQGSEWIEVYNPETRLMNIAGYQISNGVPWSIPLEFWRFPPQSWLGSHEYLIVANNGAAFRSRYGFRPDFEVTGNTGARLLFTQGTYNMHNDTDAAALTNTDPPAPTTNTSITDALSWGEDYVAGFTLPPPVAGRTYGRDANSTDTDYSSDWHSNGNALAPTPAGANSNAFFGPEVFIRVDPAWVPMQVGSGGGLIRFNIEYGNEYTTTQVMDLWTDMLYPNGTQSGTLAVRLNRFLAAQDSHTVPVQMNIPASYAQGFYRYNVHIGDYPNINNDMSYFYFEKLGQADGFTGGSDKIETIWGDEIEPTDVGATHASPLQPTQFAVLGAVPNPFNPTTAISYELRAASLVKLEVFDISGRLVTTLVNGWREAGSHEVAFDGSSLASGIYLAQLEAGEFTAVQKLVLLK